MLHRSCSLTLATALLLLAIPARAESFAFTREGVELPVRLERVVVVHGGDATVTTVSVVADASGAVSLVELPEGTAVGSLVRVASPFAAVDGLAEARVVEAREIDPCDLHTMPSSTPQRTCAGVPGASNAAAKPIAVWDAPFRARSSTGPVTVVTARALVAQGGASGLNGTIPLRALNYVRAHPSAVFALTDAEAFAFKGTATTYVWPSRTRPTAGGATWVELTVLDREQRVPRLPTLRRAQVEGVVQKGRLLRNEERGRARLALAREVLSRTGADVVEEVAAPHACLLDATNDGLSALGFSELPPGRVAVGFDPSTIPEPKTVEHPCPKRLPPHITICGPCRPSRSVVSPDPKLEEVPAFWPSVARWLGPSGRAFEVDFAERSGSPSAVLPTYEVREPWTFGGRCKDPKPGRYKRTIVELARRKPSESLVTYPPSEIAFDAAYEPHLGLVVIPAERAPLPTPTESPPDEPTHAAPRPSRAPQPVPRPSGCACNEAPGAGAVNGPGLVVAFAAGLFLALRGRR